MNPPPLSSRKDLLKWTRQILRKYSIKPVRKLSQSFVVDPLIIRSFLENLDPGLTTIEIGAGLGSLSYYLVERCKKTVVLFEIDSRLTSILAEIVNEPNSIILRSDALSHEWIAEQLVSNTPYHITSSILVKLARSNSVKRAILTLQKDVVNRLVSKPGSRDYGRITVLINTIFEIKTGPIYPPSSFYPPPEVSSQMIILTRIKMYDSDTLLLEEVTRKLFSKRRKKVGKVLSEEYGLSENDIVSIGVNPESRIYELSVGDFLRIVKLVRNYM